MNPLKLGVNIDHVATLRQARGTSYPDLVQAANIAEQAGADSITIHIREDRRHIQDADVYQLIETLNTPMNLECAVTDEMINIACKVQPTYVCLVPEKREELTTEGGLDCIMNAEAIAKATQKLKAVGIQVSLFIDPDHQQIDQAKALGVQAIEIHTGCFADAQTKDKQDRELKRVAEAAAYAADLGLIVNAGHGLHLDNVAKIAAIPAIQELNIGHAIIAQALFDGLAGSVAAMKHCLKESRS
jgi:pyridoxine 5-phosphate synthase